MATREEIMNNWVIKGMKEVGHAPEQDLLTWSMGTGIHNGNLLKGLAAEVKDAEVRQKILSDMWRFIHSVGLDKANEVLGLSAEPDVDKLNELMAAVASEAEHPAIKGLGDFIEEALVNWVRVFAVYDFAAYTYLEKHLGAEEGLHIYMKYMWEGFSLGFLDHVKEALGIEGPSDVDMDKLGQLSRVYWEAIDCSYHVSRHDQNVHEAELGDCPYWWNMRQLLGEEKCRSMSLKSLAVTSVNYYDAILKALGVWDKYGFTMDKFQCCGDDHCRVRFFKR